MKLNSLIDFKPLQFEKRTPTQRELHNWQGPGDQYFEDLRLTTLHVKKQTRLIVESSFKGFRLPAKNEQLRVRTQGQINMIAVLLQVIAAEIILDLTISTYTFNREAQSLIFQLVKDGRVKK